MVAARARGAVLRDASLSDRDARRACAPRAHGGLVAGELDALGVDAARRCSTSARASIPTARRPRSSGAVRAAVLDRYPDPTASAARASARAGVRDVAPSASSLGNGATELLWTLARAAAARRATPCSSCEPTFSELRAAASAAGARVVEWRADARRRTSRSTCARSRARARDAGARVVSLCAPASPSGAAVRGRRRRRARARRSRDRRDRARPVLPRARASATRTLARALPDNVVCVRSLTKEHAIPGVRVGYLLAAPELAARRRVVARRRGPSAPRRRRRRSRRAARATSSPRRRTRLLAERAALAAALRAVGFQPCAVEHDRTSWCRSATRQRLRRRLLERHRVLVRDCSSFGLPGHVRVAARGGEDARRIVAAFADLADAREQPVEEVVSGSAVTQAHARAARSSPGCRCP